MVLTVVLLTSAAVFTALRVYAIYGMRCWILSIVLFLGVINPAIYIIYSFVALTPGLYAHGPLMFCASFTKGNNDSVVSSWIIGARASSLLADGLVLALTWWKLFRARSKTDSASATSLTSTLVTDTGIYFLLLCIVNIVGIGTGHIFQLVPCLSTFIALLTSVLLSRLLLDLHKSQTDGTSMDVYAQTTVLFSLSTVERDMLDSDAMTDMGLHRSGEDEICPLAVEDDGAASVAQCGLHV
ncbi:uncharacterized protein C8Q71DRAFT_317713 [Rhodofomes roseus]|uniref:Uncharacterized protein n=1 Tax=Rhodofomes roseus TaxID=34475 RepID=A0ABQ8K386_9APHY|nr:uncharacterized protein C8Q71DRAFT_317713 [Rhodofomes roseus]KAH9831006.1 hypothetical protein C8Q71DRAFT_317713 [Rhodofomes roseus]